MIDLPGELFEDDSDSDLVAGLELYEAKEWEKALPSLELAALKGNVTAIFKLANSLSNLDREDEALSLWEAAAEWGHLGACNNFAIRLRNVGDIEGARELYRKSAEAGNAVSMFNLAQTYDENSETDKYLEWLQKASEAGMLRAQALLGDHYCKLGRTQEGTKLLEQAMEKGSLSAHILAGRMAYQNDDFDRAYLIANDALDLPLVDDDKHLVPNAHMIRGLSGDHLGHREQAINDVKIARDMGFDVSIAPMYLKVPETKPVIPVPVSSQGAQHYALLGR